ncbi:MAG: nucleotidyltransferase family protein [Acidobacteriota bacterium]
MTLAPSLTAVILAGGASSRMGAPKALLTWNGEPVAVRLARMFVEALGNARLVLGHDANAIRAALPPLVRASTVVNYAPQRGMLSSLQCGLRAVPHAAAGIFFLPVDYPAISASTIAAMRDAWMATPSAQILLPRSAGRRGHPVLISRAIAEELLRLPPEAAAHVVIRADESRIHYVDVDDPAIHRDADDAASFTALQREFGG